MLHAIARITPLSAFADPIRGDTLFGQLCWAIRHRWGENRLTALLEGYTQARPFLVVSDAFPAGHLPRPALPLYRYRQVPGNDRKRIKGLRWVPRDAVEAPVGEWLRRARSEADLAATRPQDRPIPRGTALWTPEAHPHNSIDRATGTTGEAPFAPYQMPRYWHRPGLEMEIHIRLDPQRLDLDDLGALFSDIGASGYGRDASIGLGRFRVDALEPDPRPAETHATTWLTLAPCAPQGLDLDPGRCWYQPFTRFGRHGDLAVHSGRPFKNPLLLADTGALLTPASPLESPFIGRGLGGEGSLSKAIPATVHQGYAPVIGVRMEERK